MSGNHVFKAFIYSKIAIWRTFAVMPLITVWPKKVSEKVKSGKLTLEDVIYPIKIFCGFWIPNCPCPTTNDMWVNGQVS